MSHYYAQIDADFTCFAILETCAPFDKENVIPIDSYDASVLGKIWSNDEWIESAS